MCNEELTSVIASTDTTELNEVKGRIFGALSDVLEIVEDKGKMPEPSLGQERELDYFRHFRTPSAQRITVNLTQERAEATGERKEGKACEIFLGQGYYVIIFRSRNMRPDLLPLLGKSYREQGETSRS